jgi:hypothetical protein
MTVMAATVTTIANGENIAGPWRPCAGPSGTLLSNDGVMVN